jgi:hypothetical protein
MGDKPRIIPNQTYVLDPRDLEELEELTIDTVMQEALDSIEVSGDESDEGSSVRPDGKVPAAVAED